MLNRAETPHVPPNDTKPAVIALREIRQLQSIGPSSSGCLAEDAVNEDDQIDRQIEIVEGFDDLLARPRDRREASPRDQVLREEHE